MATPTQRRHHPSKETAVIAPGSSPATYSVLPGTALDGRWLFAIGAAIASIVWFSALGVGARALAPVFSRPRAWEWLEALIAATMILIAAKLALG